MFCTNCGAQNDDGVFNGAYLKSIPVVGPDGITYNLPVKWLPEEVDRMNPAQLVQALTEIFPVIDELTDLVNKQMNLESECRQLEADKPTNTPKLAANVILLLAAVILCFVIGWFGIFLVIGALGSFAASMLPDAERKKAHQNLYDATCKELGEAKRRVNDYKAKNSLIIRSAYTVLPDYCCNESALVHMIASLRNHRAASLGEALNLFVTEKNIGEQNQLIQEQIRVGKLAAENASRAADAARSAASAANYAAASANRHP